MRLISLLKSKKKETLLLPQWFGISNPWDSSFETFGGAVNKATSVLDFAIAFAALVCVILLVFGGIRFITSAGDAEQVDQASKIIGGAVVGLVIVFIARLIVVYVLTDIIF